MLVGQMCRRDKTSHGRRHFYAGQDAEFRGANMNVVHRVNNHPGVGDAFTEANQDVGKQ